MLYNIRGKPDTAVYTHVTIRCLLNAYTAYKRWHPTSDRDPMTKQCPTCNISSNVHNPKTNDSMLSNDPAPSCCCCTYMLPVCACVCYYLLLLFLHGLHNLAQLSPFHHSSSSSSTATETITAAILHDTSALIRVYLFVAV